MGEPKHRHVCLPWKSSTQKFCFQVPPLGSKPAGRLKLPFKRHFPMPCKSRVDHYKPMVGQIKGQPKFDMHDDHPLLGWCTMVAPTSKTAVPPGTSFSDPPIPWYVSKLPGGVCEGAKMAPPLHSIIRKALDAKQVQNEDIDTFLKGQKNWSRYDSAFKLLWGICVFRKMVLEHMTLEQMAGNIVFLNQFSQAQARNAYSALLLLPG